MPDAALPGGEVEVRGTQLGAVRSRLPVAVLDGILAPVLLSRSNRMIVRIPEDVQTGRLEIRQNGQSSNTIRLKIARLLAGNLHPVGNPAVDAEGNIFSTDSGPRGQKTAVSVYRITPAGEMQPLVSGITNATGPGTRRPGLLVRLLPAGWHRTPRLSPGRILGLRRGHGHRYRDCVRFRRQPLCGRPQRNHLQDLPRTGRSSSLPPWNPVLLLIILPLGWMERSS